eukprot:CAMPEP_0174253550 /NCGR_PEP_ID=MMETSP0439-20130205/2918_1 /TAXON_ID=0 /ORGANISM="Stereomyxa ramosa, Strain Chinc5" /LENGTH=248 /DNA_ID=CAMNT_0015334633 /DNA_START=75 /DNA_END=821 /DNA_ORIENTATION=-
MQNDQEDGLLVCPISLELMTDPVLAEDGHTYDRASIEQWFTTHNTSPLTNLKLTSKVLIPNMLVRNLIELRQKETQKTPYIPLKQYMCKYKRLEKREEELLTDIEKLRYMLIKKEEEFHKVVEEKEDVMNFIQQRKEALEFEIDEYKCVLSSWKEVIQIFVRDGNPPAKTYFVDRGSSIGDFKLTLNLPSANSHVFFNGKKLDESKTFRECKIQKDDTIAIKLLAEYFPYKPKVKARQRRKSRKLSGK